MVGGGKDNTHEAIVAKFRLQTQGTKDGDRRQSWPAVGKGDAFSEMICWKSGCFFFSF